MSNSSQSIPGLSVEKRNALESRFLEKLKPRSKPAATDVHTSSEALSFAQEGLWFLEQFKPNSPLYNIPQAFRLRGGVNVNALSKAFESIVQRHAILRANYRVESGKPKQSIRAHGSFSLQQVDLSESPDSLAKAKDWLQLEAQRPFNLEHDSLIRAALVKLSDDDHILLIVLHHIISDFSSLVVLYRELGEAYSSIANEKQPVLPELKIQFPEWAANQKAKIQGDALERKLKYWKEKLAGDLPTLEMPTDHPRPAERTFRGAKHELSVSSEMLDRLKQLSKAEGATLYLTLLTAFAVVLRRYTGQRELVIGSPIDQRNTSDAEKLIGYFINTLPLRIRFPETCSFRQALQEARSVALGAFVNQEIAFEKIVESLQLARNADNNPLFQVVFQYLPALPRPTLEGLVTTPENVHTQTAKFDLTFTTAETEEGLVGEIEYNLDIFSPETIERFATHFKTLLCSAAAAPEQDISRLNLLPEEEHNRILVEWNETATKFPHLACVHELFEEQANRSPQSIALKFEGQAVTYAELNNRANQLAHHLKKLGVGPDSLVGLAVGRSVEMIVGLLGILKAGGAYVPLDPVYPAERLDYIINDTGLTVLVTNRRFVEIGSNIRHKVFLDDDSALLAQEKTTNVASGCTAENLAYVMYTSGSTGRPKGVLVPHRGIVRLVKETNYVHFSTSDVFLQFATLSFDASTFEIWGALLNGAKLVIYPPEMPSLADLGNFLLKEEITTLWLTAGLFHQMVDDHVDKLKGLKQLLAGGDVLSVPQIMTALRELPTCRIVNGYGPTENTTFTCCYSVPRTWHGASLPIGKPISNTSVYILDETLQPVPIGVPGELFIGGAGLAREYLNAPELNAKKFLQNPFSSKTGDRLYRTGDRVRWLCDGSIEFLGRFDNQVKVRGFRIELGEVENVLAQHPSVKEAAVLARQNGAGKELVAYVVPHGLAAMDCSAIRSYLQEKLPSYMVPAHIVPLEKFPLNANGKIDRQKLPAPEVKTSSPNERKAPRNPVEQRLLEIWMEVLGGKDLGIDDNFFDLGGHSLLATQIISRASVTFGKDLPLRLLFEFPTIAAFAEAICRNRGETAPENSPIRKRTRVSAARLDQLSDSQIETLFQSSQSKT